MAKIEFSVLTRACLKGRNPDADALQRRITAYETQRNSVGVTINWWFSAQAPEPESSAFRACLSNAGRVLIPTELGGVGSPFACQTVSASRCTAFLVTGSRPRSCGVTLT